MLLFDPWPARLSGCCRALQSIDTLLFASLPGCVLVTECSSEMGTERFPRYGRVWLVETSNNMNVTALLQLREAY